jgi:hypothetical protein
MSYVEVPGLPHWWAAEADINEKIWKFFVDHMLSKTSDK